MNAKLARVTLPGMSLGAVVVLAGVLAVAAMTAMPAKAATSPADSAGLVDSAGSAGTAEIAAVDAQSQGGQGDQGGQGSYVGARPQMYSFALRASYLWDHFALSEGQVTAGNTFTSVVYRGRPGGGIEGEYLFVPTFGLDLAASQTGILAKETTFLPAGPPIERRGTIDARAFTLALNEHPLTSRRVDFYIGIFAGAEQYSGGGFRANSTQFAFGANLGFDFPLGDSGFALTAAGRVLSARFPEQLSRADHFRAQILYGGGLTYRW